MAFYPQPKPEPRKRIKARRSRRESATIRAVRRACVERDGACRVGRDFSDGRCEGPSEWAHFGAHKRARTRGQAPERRHTVAGSLMLCRAHHTAYDAGRLVIDAGDAGTAGPLRYRWTRESRTGAVTC